MTVRSLFSFPDPVNETSARLVAAGVVVQGIAFLLLREGWVLLPLVYGFLARVATGPTMSPLGQFATRVATPALERQLASRPSSSSFASRHVPGPPKRFAQGVGLIFSTGALLAWTVNVPLVSMSLIVMLVVAATAEAAFALCAGCVVYNAIWGCADCDDIGERMRSALADEQPEPAGSISAQA